MASQSKDFSNQIGNELFRLLMKRATEALSGQSDLDRFTAMLGAALIAVAEVPRSQVEKSSDVSKLVGLSSRWLWSFLESAAGKGTT